MADCVSFCLYVIQQTLNSNEQQAKCLMNFIIKLKFMEIFPIFKKVWSETEDDWTETSEILWFEAVSATGHILARGETKQETMDSALFSAYAKELPV